MSMMYVHEKMKMNETHIAILRTDCDEKTDNSLLLCWHWYIAMPSNSIWYFYNYYHISYCDKWITNINSNTLGIIASCEDPVGHLRIIYLTTGIICVWLRLPIAIRYRRAVLPVAVIDTLYRGTWDVR